MKMDASTLDTDSNSNDNASTRAEENKDLRGILHVCCFVQVISLQYLREQLVEDFLLWNQEIYRIEYSFEFLGYLI